MRPIFIITGLMGSGKSTVSNYIKYRNHDVIKMDDFAKSLIATSAECKISLIKNFGKDMINDSGSVLFDELKKVYFKPEFERKRIKFENDLDILITEELNKIYYLNSEDLRGCSPIFIEIPALSANRFLNFINNKNIVSVIIVECDEDIRHERLLKRGMTEEQIKERDIIQDLNDIKSIRESKQIPEIIISNDGEEKDLYNDVTKILQDIGISIRRTIITSDLANRIMNMPESIVLTVMCLIYKNIGGCCSCPYPCKKCNDI